MLEDKGSVLSVGVCKGQTRSHSEDAVYIYIFRLVVFVSHFTEGLVAGPCRRVGGGLGGGGVM